MSDTPPNEPSETPAEAAPVEAAPAVPHGLVQHRNDDGSVCCETPYEHGVKQGEGRMYYTTGALYAVENYARDVLNGPTKLYYPTGVLQAELEYVDGLLQGTVKEYYADGRLESVSEYRAGEKHGVSTVHDETGLHVTRETWTEGTLTGTATGSP